MMLSELLTEFSLPAESVNEVAPTCTVAVPDAPVDGVKVAVYEFPDPAKSESAPPLTEIAPSRKSVELSESVNVRLAVSPAFNYQFDPPLRSEHRYRFEPNSPTRQMWVQCLLRRR